MDSFNDLTTAQLKQALQYREQIESLQEKLNVLLGGKSTVAKRKPGRPAGKKRTMSPEGRAKIAAAQKARWAAKKGLTDVAKKPVGKKKRGMTAERKAKLSAAMKASWAAKKKTAPAA